MPPVTRQLLFQGLREPWVLGNSLLAVLVALVMIVWLFRYERRLVRPAVGRVLLTLRLGVLGLILLTLLQPVLGWTLNRSLAGRIIVAVDVSESMSLTDPKASPEEKLRWARALGMISRDASEHWLAELKHAGTTPAQPDSNGEAAAVNEKLTKAKQESLQRVLRDVEKFSRKQLVEKLLLETQAPLLKQLEPLGQLEIHLFGGSQLSCPPENLSAMLAAPPAVIGPETTDLSIALQPTGSGTDGAGNIRGIVLLTDGRDTSRKNPLMAAAALKAANTPVFPILIGSINRPKDLAVVTLEFPQTVYKGDHPKLKGVINTSGFEGQPVTIELHSLKNDRPPMTKTITGGEVYTTVEFELDGTRIGRHEFELRIPVQPDELRDDNNARKFAMQVVDDRAQVLIVDGGPRWEFRFLETTLTRDERISVKKVLYEQPFLGALDESFFPRELKWPADPADVAKSPFADLDLVIVGDVSPEKWPEASWQLLEKYVGEGGGTVIFSAGKRSFPLGHRSLTLERLLPVQFLVAVDLNLPNQTQLGPIDRGLQFRLTPEGSQQPPLQFANEEAANQRMWEALPGPLWAISGETKPAATNWLEGIGPRGDANPVNAKRSGLIVHQNYGLGQVIWIGFDSTWRWRNLAGDEWHHRFWGQLARSAAIHKVSGGNEFVRFGADRPDIEQSEEAVFRAKWTPSFRQKYPFLKPKVELQRFEEGEWKPYATLDMLTDPVRPLASTARAVALPTGQYLGRLVVPDVPELNRQPIEAPLHVQPRASAELGELSAHRELLQQLAQATDGRMFEPDELAELPQQFRTFQAQQLLQQETPLWDHWVWLTLICGVLTVEWTIRKWHGLP